ncbi:hypothetical protein AXF13_07185 [Desulfovibrio fairfieldensis]|uniref:Uncharacterized protein n=1 Tax=Desulfovibrio fairfieldensis TaxID=44742 RepID=A0A0X8JJH8_9BACT|nr:hypothetical protein AXF13_07185 [Desulfovibrio fairfieldensis]
MIKTVPLVQMFFTPRPFCYKGIHNSRGEMAFLQRNAYPLHTVGGFEFVPMYPPGFVQLYMIEYYPDIGLQ